MSSDVDTEWIREGHETILKVLYDTGGEHRSGEIRSLTDIPEGSIHHFLTPLRERGLVEVAATEELSGAAGEAPLYTITTRGRSAAKELLNRRPQDLSARIEQLEDDADGLQAEAVPREEYEQLRASHEALSERVDGIADGLKGEYRDWIVNQVKQEIN